MVSLLILWRKASSPGLLARPSAFGCARGLPTRLTPSAPLALAPHPCARRGRAAPRGRVRPRARWTTGAGRVGADRRSGGGHTRAGSTWSSLRKPSDQVEPSSLSGPRSGAASCTEPRRSPTEYRRPPAPHAETTSRFVGASCGRCNLCCDGVPRHRAGISSAPILWSLFSVQPTPAISCGREAAVSLHRSVGRHGPVPARLAQGLPVLPSCRPEGFPSPQTGAQRPARAGPGFLDAPSSTPSLHRPTNEAPRLGADRRSGGGQSRPKLDLISGCASSRIAGRAFKPNRPP